MRSTPGVVCAQINCRSDNTARLVARGSASVQDIVLVLKGLGYHANVFDSCCDQANEEETCGMGNMEGGGETPKSAAFKKSSVFASPSSPDLGYIADMKSIFAVRGMTCGSCVASVEKSINKVNGVKHVSVALLTETAEVLYDGKLSDWKALLIALEEAGYEGTHIYTSNASSVEYSRRLFAVDMTRGSHHHSAFNCSSVVAHTVGLISLNWVNDGAGGQDSYQGGPVSSSARNEAAAGQDQNRLFPASPLGAAAYSGLPRRQSFTGMSPEVFSTLPVDITIDPNDASTQALESVDLSSIKPNEVILQAVYDSQLVGLRTIYETMCSLNPHFGVRLLPEKVIRVYLCCIAACDDRFLSEITSYACVRCCLHTDDTKVRRF